MEKPSTIELHLYGETIPARVLVSWGLGSFRHIGIQAPSAKTTLDIIGPAESARTCQPREKHMRKGATTQGI